jgi:DNA-binding NarL/FixJ family response regulator
MEPLYLMLVEGHAAVRFALETRLASSPLIKQIDTFADVPSALQALRVAEPDLILLGLEGYRAATLRQKSEAVVRLAAQNRPVMVLLPYMDELQRELLLRAGAKRCFLKNINTPQLLHEIVQVVRQSRQPAAPKTNTNTKPTILPAT